MKRKFSTKTKIAFYVLSALTVVMLAGLAIAARSSVVTAKISVPLPEGTIVYDGDYKAITTVSNAVVTKAGNGVYMLEEENTSVPLGTHTIAYTGEGIMPFGGGYLFATNGDVIKLEDGAVYNCDDTNIMMKLADRRYVMLGSTITDTNSLFRTEKYLYVVMDMVGNARMLSNTVSLRSTQPTTIKSGIAQFDIANELLTLSGTSLKLSNLIGSTNIYDSGKIKRIEEEQTPDVIDVTIKGGDGGNGGTGGTGGKGGTGGDGGDGGDGGTGEDKKAVEIVQINGVTPSARELKVDYYFVDPFGALGMVYVELHEVSELDKIGVDPAKLYELEAEGDTSVEPYLEKFDNRVSVSTYNSSYIFKKLKPNTEYYVVMGHLSQNSLTDALEKTLDDYIKVKTLPVVSSISIDEMDLDGNVSGVLDLESLTFCPVGSVLVVLNAQDATLELSNAQIERAVADGLKFSFQVKQINTLKTINIVLKDLDGNVLIDKVVDNTYYIGG